MSFGLAFVVPGVCYAMAVFNSRAIASRSKQESGTLTHASSTGQASDPPAICSRAVIATI
jgi:hypothetical protein